MCVEGTCDRVRQWMMSDFFKTPLGISTFACRVKIFAMYAENQQWAMLSWETKRERYQCKWRTEFCVYVCRIWFENAFEVCICVSRAPAAAKFVASLTLSRSSTELSLSRLHIDISSHTLLAVKLRLPCRNQRLLIPQPSRLLSRSVAHETLSLQHQRNAFVNELAAVTTLQCWSYVQCVMMRGRQIASCAISSHAAQNQWRNESGLSLSFSLSISFSELFSSTVESSSQ